MQEIQSTTNETKIRTPQLSSKNNGKEQKMLQKMKGVNNMQSDVHSYQSQSKLEI